MTNINIANKMCNNFHNKSNFQDREFISHRIEERPSGRLYCTSSAIEKYRRVTGDDESTRSEVNNFLIDEFQSGRV